VPSAAFFDLASDGVSGSIRVVRIFLKLDIFPTSMQSGSALHASAGAVNLWTKVLQVGQPAVPTGSKGIIQYGVSDEEDQ